MKIDVITFGKAIRDIILKTDQDNFEKISQEKIIVKKTYLDIGGGAANVAVGLVKLGYNVAPVIVLGEDPEGEEIRERLERRGVDSSMISENKDTSTGISVILQNKKNEHLVYIYTGANRLLDTDMIRWKEAAQAKYWYLLSVGNQDIEFLNQIAKKKEQSKARLVFNPGRLQLKQGQKKLSTILSATDILMVNQSEAENLSGVEGDEIFKELVGMGPKIVVVTRGKQGAAAYGGREIIKSSVYPQEKVNAVGAGDSFGSGFIASFMKNGNIEQSLKWGIANSAAVVSKFGAQKGLLTKGEILKRVQEDKIEIKKERR